MKPDIKEQYALFRANKLLREWAAWSRNKNDNPRMMRVDKIVSSLPERMRLVVKEEYIGHDVSGVEYRRPSERRRASYLLMERRDYRALLFAGKLLTIDRWDWCTKSHLFIRGAA
jgi:hypothetical protein